MEADSHLHTAVAGTAVIDHSGLVSFLEESESKG